MLYCDGTRCHSECELGHLDNVEKTRHSKKVEWKRVNKPERSGSTWLYNAVRLLHREARVCCNSYWIHTLTESKITERLQAGNVICIKTHEWNNDYVRWIPSLSKHIILTHRDLRGVVASYRRVGWAHSLSERYVPDHMQWKNLCTLDIAYEDIVRDGKQQLQILSSHLGLHLEEAAMDIVHDELKILGHNSAYSGYGVNQITKIWPNHVSAKNT